MAEFASGSKWNGGPPTNQANPIYDKLGVNSRTQAAANAQKRGIL